jgi:acyl carrier protein
MTAVLAPPATTWTAPKIEVVVIDLIARLLGENTDDLRRRLLEKDMSMPIDSLDLLDVLQEFRDITGLRVPVRKLGRQTMRSVSAFSRFVANQGTV